MGELRTIGGDDPSSTLGSTESPKSAPCGNNGTKGIKIDYALIVTNSTITNFMKLQFLIPVNAGLS